MKSVNFHRLDLRVLSLCFFFIMCVKVCYPKSILKTNNSIEINVKTFGAKGDGITDDYPALIAAAEAINKKGTGTLFFPKGTYYIAPYNRKGNVIKNIVFRNCNNLKISGYNARIVVNGKFRRTTDYIKGKVKFSNSFAVTPLFLQKCKNVVIEGLELDGSVDDMTKDNGVIEGGGILLQILNCSDVFLKNLFIHHSQTDGLYIGEKTSNLRAENVVSSNNARQGMSIISLFGGRFEGCKFINTGYTDGSYGSHSPRAGVDIEPKNSNVVEVKDVYFNDCLFENNFGAQFICTSPKTSVNITLNRCTINAGDSRKLYQVRLTATNVQLLNSNVNCKEGSVYPVWKNEPGTRVIIKGCTIMSSASGIESISETGDNITIEDNIIIFTGKSAVKTFFPYLKTRNIDFKNNRVVIPEQYRKKGTTSLLPKGKLSIGNTFHNSSENLKSNL